MELLDRALEVLEVLGKLLFPLVEEVVRLLPDLSLRHAEPVGHHLNTWHKELIIMQLLGIWRNIVPRCRFTYLRHVYACYCYTIQGAIKQSYKHNA